MQKHRDGSPAQKSSVPSGLRVLIPLVLIAVWLGVGSAGGKMFSEINDVATNDRADQLPESAESTKVAEMQHAFRASDAIPAIMVLQRDGGLTDADDELVEDLSSEINAMDEVEQISQPIVSEDEEAVEVIALISATDDVGDIVQDMREIASDYAEGDDGLAIYVAGPAGLTADIIDAFSGIDGLLLVVALIAVLIILIVVYRSPLLPILVLGTAVMALSAAVWAVVALAKADILTLSGQTQGIMFILVIGAATDYSLLYVARYREALRDYESKWQATLAAWRGSFGAILASGGTVISALLILLLSQLATNRGMGPAGAIGIAFAILSALTLLPALLLGAGRAAFWPRRPKFGSPHPAIRGENATGLWPRVGKLISTHPRRTWIGATAVLLLGCLGLIGLRAGGVAESEFVLGESQARDGQRVISEHFAAGSGNPTILIAPEDSIEDVAQIVLNTQGVASLAAVSEESPAGFFPVTEEGVQPLGGPDGMRGDPTIVDGNVLLEATLTDAPDSLEAEETITVLRAELHDDGILVGGPTATALDTNTSAAHDRNLIIPLVLIAILLILMVLLRAVLAPILLVASVVVSFGTALGISSLVFNHVLDFPGADPSVPMFGFVFLVALGIDYNIFLMTRVREESLQHGTREGIVRGLVQTGGVITSAGLVLAATFAALGVLPILFLAQISFIVAFGVLLDTFLVRSLLIPALTHDIGSKIWWPSKKLTQ
ncbi:MAG TPA: MMPL family transporter [Actinomycetales bacterium]|nr:MMPL family transporter [Actinomycetales bacterium]